MLRSGHEGVQNDDDDIKTTEGRGEEEALNKLRGVQREAPGLIKAGQCTVSDTSRINQQGCGLLLARAAEEATLEDAGDSFRRSDEPTVEFFWVQPFILPEHRPRSRRGERGEAAVHCELGAQEMIEAMERSHDAPCLIMAIGIRAPVACEGAGRPTHDRQPETGE